MVPEFPMGAPTAMPTVYTYPPIPPISMAVRKAVIRRTAEQKRALQRREGGDEAQTGAQAAGTTSKMAGSEGVSKTGATPNAREGDSSPSKRSDAAKQAVNDGDKMDIDSPAEVPVEIVTEPGNLTLPQMRAMALQGTIAVDAIQKRLDELKSEKHEIFSNLKKKAR